MAWHSIVMKGNLGLFSQLSTFHLDIGVDLVFPLFFFHFSTETGIGLIPPMCTMHIQHGFLECSRLVMCLFFPSDFGLVFREVRELWMQNWRLMMVYDYAFDPLWCTRCEYVWEIPLLSFSRCHLALSMYLGNQAVSCSVAWTLVWSIWHASGDDISWWRCRAASMRRT